MLQWGSMDPNKAKRLTEIGYQIQRVCLLCTHSQLNGLWGTCAKETYFHDKHQRKMPLSINAAGSCPEWELNEQLDLHKFVDYFPPQRQPKLNKS